MLLLLTVLASVRVVAAEPSKVVLLEAVGTPVDVDALRISLEDWLRSMQLELHLVSVLPLPEEPSFARVRVVWTDETCVVEVFAANGALRRRKALPRGGPALLVSESAALIAQAGVQELSIEERARQELPVAVAAPAPPPVVEAPVEPSISPVGLGVAAYLQGRSYNSAAPFVFGGGAEVAAIFGEGPWHPGVSLLLGYQGPVGQDAEQVVLHVQLQTMQVRLLPTVRRQFGPLEAELGLGGGLDALFASSTSELTPPSLRPHKVDAAPFLTAAAALRWRVTPDSAVFLRAVVDLDPARRRYVSRVADQVEYLLVPWLARPALQLGFSFELVSLAERAP